MKTSELSQQQEQQEQQQQQQQRWPFYDLRRAAGKNEDRLLKILEPLMEMKYLTCFSFESSFESPFESTLRTPESTP